MTRYKHYSYKQSVFIPINFNKQILPCSFEYALNYIVDNELDLSVFESRYNNNDPGAPAYDPAIMLKIVLYAYSKGITSSLMIDKLCKENIIFMVLSADTKPHFTTIADFVCSINDQITPLFRDILLYCQGLDQYLIMPNHIQGILIIHADIMSQFLATVIQMELSQDTLGCATLILGSRNLNLSAISERICMI